ncbi:MAG: InlB B-repeat-containing protein [Roseburia sp.]|nr:InlB B-repeat-containing protein [Roseburia sp.]
MKNKRLLTVFLAIVLAFSGAALLACGKKSSDDTTYTVTFIGTNDPDVTVEAGGYIDLPTPTLDGYTFAGWFTDSAYTDRFYGGPVESDLTLHAYWQDGTTVQYTLRFYNNSQLVSEKTVDAGGTLKYSQFPILSQRDGYVAYWSSGDMIINSDIIGVDRNMDINAVYESESAVKTVIFDSRGGSEVDKQLVRINEKATYPVEPYKDEKYFAGWFTDTNYNIEYDFDSAVLNNITLYAKWSDEEPVAEHGTVVTFGIPKIVGDFNGWNYNVSQTPNPASGRKGYKFNPLCDSRVLVVYSKVYVLGSGWTFNEAYNLSGERVIADLSNASRVEKNSSLDDYYTVWVRDSDGRLSLDRFCGGVLTQSYDADSGVLQVRAVHKVGFEVGDGSSVPTQYISHGDTAIEPEDPTLLGKVFCGWTTVSGTPVNVSAQVINANTMYYAKWDDAYIVTFDTRGGTDVTSQTVSKSSPYIVEPYYPSYSGYYFAGWYTDIECTGKFDFSSPISSDITLYAKWNAIVTGVDRTVTFDYCGGTVSATQSRTVSVVSGRTISPLLYSPRKNGQYLKGWYRDAACNVPFDFDEIIYTDTTLYAKYETIPSGYYVVYFDCSPRLPKLTQVGKNPYGYSIISDNSSTVLRDGYGFTGWYTDAACTVRAQNWVQGTSGQVVTLYAGWEKVETRSFTYYNHDGTVFKVEEHRYGGPMTYNQLAKPNARTGFVFVGWYTDSALTTKFPDSMTVVADVKLYPMWEAGVAKHVVFYDMNGSVFASDLAYEGTRSKSDITGLVNPVKNGYVFNQWFLDSDRTYPLPESYNVTDDFALYGSWIEDKSSQVTGGGTQGSPYSVSNYDQFASHLLKTGNASGKYYKFTANVAFGAGGNELLPELNASVDFGGYSVTGVTRPMFESIAKGAQFIGAKITANITKMSALRTQYVGIVSCYSSGYIGNVWTLGTVNLPNVKFVGGVVGSMSGSDTRNYTIIENCLNSANVTALDYAGGIAGSLNSGGQILRYSVNEGIMTATQGSWNNGTNGAAGKYYKHASGVVGSTSYPYRVIACVTTTEGLHENVSYGHAQAAIAGYMGGNGSPKCVNGLPNTLNGTYHVDRNSTADILNNWLNYHRIGEKCLTCQINGNTGYVDDSGDQGGPDFFSENSGTWYSDNGKFRLEYFKGR